MAKLKSKKSKSVSKKKENQITLGQQIGKVLVNYLTTQFMLMILVGVATWGILSLLNVGYPILLAVITGVLSGVPGFGMTISTIVIAVVAILDKLSMWANSPAWLEAIIIVAIFFVFNKVVDLIIAPIFLGKTAKMNPLIVILLVIIGTLLMGIWGAILAVPVYLVIRAIVEYFSK